MSNVYEIITNKVISALENGNVPWHKPWHGSKMQPRNGITGVPYRGINPFLLEVSRQTQGFKDSRWLTFKQTDKIGGKVKKGSKSTAIIFWHITERLRNGVTEKVPILKYYNVFNVDQLEINPAKLFAIDDYEASDWEGIPFAEAMFTNWLELSGIEFLVGDCAAYSPINDSIMMPDKSRFPLAEDYYATAFHESIHSTGHSSRLNRIETTSFGSEKYAKEELIAEMGSAFLCSECNIEGTFDNSVAYIKGWLKALKDDSKLVIVAASAAQKAVDLILNREMAVIEE